MPSAPCSDGYRFPDEVIGYAVWLYFRLRRGGGACDRHRLLVIMASSVVGWIVTFEQIPAAVTAWMTTYLSNPWLIILAMNLILIFLGMFIDLPAAVLLVTPIFLPLASSIGMDGVQLGVMMVVNLAMGLYTPPVGTKLFIASSVAKVPMGAVVKEMMPFYGVALLVLFLVSYVPAFSLRG
jgi:TRAP-type transport system large permease protein